MGFITKLWKDRQSEFPNRRTLTKEDQSTELVTVTRSEGIISEEGDAFSAENMNDLETRIKNAIGTGTIPEALGADIIAALNTLNTNLSNLEDTILAASDTTFTFSSDTVFTTYGVQRIIKSGKTVSIYLHYQVNNALTSSAYFGNIPAGYRPYKQITGISPINVQSGSRGTVKIETNGNITATTTFATGVYVLIFAFPAA